MRLLTWNLCGGDKREVAAQLDCDLAVFQERRACDAAAGELWFGDPRRKGVSGRASSAWRLQAIEAKRAFPRYFVPMQVTGRESFQLISVWAMPEDRYVRGLVRAVHRWRERIAAQPTVIAGDFNANVTWDHHHPPDRNFSALARRLDALGLVSAYHVFFNEEFGAETRPTFFLYRHVDRPFHIDFCFIPKAWVPRLRNVTVGRHEQWARWSDHMPVMVEVEG
jgi:exodeoxyribonuclease-3